MTDPLVSVLIPCFNAERWISDTLDSVFAQTWRNVEIVVVNDGSTDASEAVVRGRSSSAIKLVTQDNLGQTAALNRCLREAQGEFIQYLDADDLLTPRKIEIQMARLRESPRSVATSEWARFWGNPETASFTADVTWRDLDPVDWLIASWRKGEGMLFPGLWLCPRSLVSEIGPWREDLTLNNDAEYFTRLVLAAERVLFCPGSRVLYRSGNPGSLAATKTERGWRSQHSVLEACQRYLLAHEDSDRARLAVSMLWQRFAYASYPYTRALAEDAVARSRSLHSAQLPLEGGAAFKLVSKVFGWRVARRLQRATGRA